MNENIIEINVPNFITITVMAMVGALVVGIVRKFVMGRMSGGQGATTGKGANTTLYGMAA